MFLLPICRDTPQNKIYPAHCPSLLVMASDIFQTANQNLCRSHLGVAPLWYACFAMRNWIDIIREYKRDIQRRRN